MTRLFKRILFNQATPQENVVLPYSDSHYNDKTVPRPSSLLQKYQIWKDRLYIEEVLFSQSCISSRCVPRPDSNFAAQPMRDGVTL